MISDCLEGFDIQDFLKVILNFLLLSQLTFVFFYLNVQGKF